MRKSKQIKVLDEKIDGLLDDIQALKHSLYYVKQEKKTLEENLTKSQRQTKIWHTDFLKMRQRVRVAIRDEKE